MQVESPPQQADASVDSLYSLVLSVKSSGGIHEVYIDAHFHYTALKVKQHSSVGSRIVYLLMLVNMQILKLRRKHKVYGDNDKQYFIKNFRFASTASSGGSLRVIVPEKNPHITAVETEDGMVTCLNGQLVDVKFHLCFENLRGQGAKTMYRGTKRGDGFIY